MTTFTPADIARELEIDARELAQVEHYQIACWLDNVDYAEERRCIRSDHRFRADFEEYYQLHRAAFLAEAHEKFAENYV